MNTPSAPPETPRMAASATTFPVNPYAAPSEPPLMAAPATTTPVNPQPAALHLGPRHPATWSSGLLDCCDNVSNCCITCWCPCITFGQIAEIIDRGSTPCGVSAVMYSIVMLVAGCPWLYSCFYRSKLRGQYFMEEKPCRDCCVHFWCEPCALCQEYRELQKQGYDMSIGWHGNLERRQRGNAVMAPSVEGGMMR